MAKKIIEDMNRRKGTGSLQREPNGIYTIRATINGKRFAKSTRTRDRAEAEKIMAQFLKPFVKDDEVRTYENLQAFVESSKQRQEREEDEKPQLTLADAWDAYVASPKRRDLAAATLEAKAMVWKKYVEWLGINYPQISELRHVSVEMVEAYLSYLRIDHSASTYNNRLCVIREMHRVLMEKARAKKNPWEDMKLREDDSCRRRELTVEELQRLVHHARRAGEEWERLFCVGVYTGLRLGDCTQLEWKCVDIVRSIIQIIPHKTKKFAKGRPVTIPIHPALMENLCQTKVSDRLGYVMPQIASWYRVDRPKVSYHINRIFHAAGIVTSVKVEGRKWKVPEATFHSLRHTFVSLSANAGVPLHIVQSIVGHESTAMTRHYYHENEKALRQAVAAIPAIGETNVKQRGIGFFQGGMNEPAQGVEYFPKELEAQGYDAPPAPVEVPYVEPSPAQAFSAMPTITTPPPAPAASPAPQTVPEPPAKPLPTPEVEVLEPEEEAEEEKPRVVIPHGAKVEIREFGRVYVDGVPTGGRIGGAIARPRPPKAAWFGDIMARWSKRRKIGMLEGTMELVANGGHKFLQQLYDKNTIHDPGEALDVMCAYLKGRGIEFDD